LCKKSGLHVLHASHCGKTIFSIDCETQISKTKCIEICKSNNPAQRRVMRPKLQKHRVLKLVGRIILPMHGYHTPQLAAELGSRICLDSYP
jgi:hypothetical protein